jgi:DNA repair protein RecO (recombination protein O)
MPADDEPRLNRPMAGPVKTEAVVLRSMRYGEADRILHVYTPHRGRISAIAKGVRRTRSRFGGRLEPFFRLRMDLHEGRGELLTVTGAQTVDAYPRLRGNARALDSAARACDAVGRLFETGEPHPGVFNLLCRHLALLDEQTVGTGGAGRTSTGNAGTGGTGTNSASTDRSDGRSPTTGEGTSNPPAPGSTADGRAGALAFRLKLLLAAGLAPQLGACACCGEREHLVGFSGSAGGVVCGACEAASFPLDEAAYDFMTEALGRPLTEIPDAPAPTLGQVERAIAETLEHHAHLRLMPAAARSA